MNSTNQIRKKQKKIRLSYVSIFHYYRLLYRSLLLILTLYWYIRERIAGRTVSLHNVDHPFLIIVWGVFMVEMILRCFPSKIESPGCQKQFKKNYQPTGRTDVKLHDNNAVIIVALVWILFNGVIGGLYMIHLIDEGILLLICLAYSVCDMICILFFCPFQTWFLKNRCCSSCRIYNWDYAMMFTPLFFIPGTYTWTLLMASMVILLRWEIVVWLFPERFSENTNQYLACANCTEKLCSHKKQLKKFRVELVKYAEKQTQRILHGKSKN